MQCTSQSNLEVSVGVFGHATSSYGKVQGRESRRWKKEPEGGGWRRTMWREGEINDRDGEALKTMV